MSIPLTLLSILPIISATNLQLTSVQPIVGFSAACFNAYNQRLPSCSFDDLLSSVGGKNGGCSSSCISDLLAAQVNVQASCQGERASRQTVIGQMFLGTAASFLCGDIGGGGGGGGGQSSSATQTSTAATIATPTTTMGTAAPVDTSTTSQTVESTTQSPSSVVTSTTEGDQSSSTTAAVPTQTANAGNNNDGNGNDGSNSDGAGGGSPFDAGPGSAAARATAGSLHLLGTAMMALILLLR